MPELKICAAIQSDSKLALELASQLELDRGCAVIGTVWTKGDMLEYLQNPYSKLFGWSDEPSSEPLEDGQVFARCKYKVVVGITYEVNPDENGTLVYDGKFIDHLVVDGSAGPDLSYKYVFTVLDTLAGTWNDKASVRKLNCAIDSRDIRWKDLLEIAGFTELSRVEVDDALMIHMQCI